jgi:hypothetical protein
MIKDDDLRNTELLSRERIKGFLYDKKIRIVSKHMKEVGIGLSHPVLAILAHTDNDVHFATLRKISYYINNYLELIKR